MGVIGNAVEEIKSMPKEGKILLAVGVAGAIGLALYMRAKSGGTTSVAPGAASSNTGFQGLTGTDLSGSSASQGSTTGTTTSTTGTTTGTTTTGTTTTPPPPKVTKPPAAPKVSTYVVQRGDSLSEIASKLHIKGGWQALYNKNKSVIGGNPSLIYSGTKLNITGLT